MKLETRPAFLDAGTWPFGGWAFLLLTLVVSSCVTLSVTSAKAPRKSGSTGISVPAVLNVGWFGCAQQINWRPDGTGIAASVVANTQRLNGRVVLWGLKSGDPPPRCTTGPGDLVTKWLDNDTVEFESMEDTEHYSPFRLKALKWSSKTMDGEIRGGVLPHKERAKVLLKGGRWVAYVDFDDTRITRRLIGVVYPLIVKDVASGKELFRSPKDASVRAFGVSESKGYIVYGAELPWSGELHRVTISGWKNVKVGHSRSYYRSVAIRSSNGDFAVAADDPARQQRIWVYRADGGVKSVSPAELSANCPTWSPDGRLLAFASHRGEIRVINGGPMRAADWNARPSSNWRLGPPSGLATMVHVEARLQSK